MRELVFNLDKHGLNTVFEPYEELALQSLWSSPELSSQQVHAYVNAELGKAGTGISRASIIYFLNEMVDRCFLDCREVTGKGGYKRLYRFPAKLGTEKLFREDLANMILRHLHENIISYTSVLACE